MNLIKKIKQSSAKEFKEGRCILGTIVQKELVSSWRRDGLKVMP